VPDQQIENPVLSPPGEVLLPLLHDVLSVKPERYFSIRDWDRSRCHAPGTDPPCRRGPSAKRAGVRPPSPDSLEDGGATVISRLHVQHKASAGPRMTYDARLLQLRRSASRNSAEPFLARCTDIWPVSVGHARLIHGSQTRTCFVVILITDYLDRKYKRLLEMFKREGAEVSKGSRSLGGSVVGSGQGRGSGVRLRRPAADPLWLL